MAFFKCSKRRRQGRSGRRQTAEEEFAVREEGKEVEAAVVEGTGKGKEVWEEQR